MGQQPSSLGRKFNAVVNDENSESEPTLSRSTGASRSSCELRDQYVVRHRHRYTKRSTSISSSVFGKAVSGLKTVGVARKRQCTKSTNSLDSTHSVRWDCSPVLDDVNLMRHSPLFFSSENTQCGGTLQSASSHRPPPLPVYYASTYSVSGAGAYSLGCRPAAAPKASEHRLNTASHSSCFVEDRFSRGSSGRMTLVSQSLKRRFFGGYPHHAKQHPPKPLLSPKSKQQLRSNSLEGSSSQRLLQTMKLKFGRTVGAINGSLKRTPLDPEKPGPSSDGDYVKSSAFKAPKLYSINKRKADTLRRKTLNKNAQIFRNLVNNWSVRDLHCLVVEYESSLAQREMTLIADAARPQARTLSEDLLCLFENGWCSDFVLVYDSVEFHVHRSIILNRSPFLREILLAQPLNAKRVSVNLLSRRGLLQGKAPHSANRRSPPNTEQRKLSVGAKTTSTTGFTTRLKCAFSSDSDFVSAKLFAQYLRYLYSGQFSLEDVDGDEQSAVVALSNLGLPTSSQNSTSDYAEQTPAFYKRQPQSTTVYWLNRFRLSNNNDASSDHLVTGNLLQYDLRTMLHLSGVDLHSGSSDTALFYSYSPCLEDVSQLPTVLSRSVESVDQSGSSASDQRSFVNKLSLGRRGCKGCIQQSCAQPASVFSSKSSQFRCHMTVLASRSPFFRNLIQRRLQNQRTEPQLRQQSPTRSLGSDDEQLLQIMLDDSVIPRQFCPVVLHAFYTDEIDLSLVVPQQNINVNSLSAVQAIAAGKSFGSPIDESVQLYQIAKFLEFERLAQGCEDIIAAHMSLDVLPCVWSWASESSGSAWIRRRCIHLLSSQFSAVADSALLYDLDEQLLVEVLASDFVQATELEILNAVIHWGEHQLVRRIEDREPNLLYGTAHSISRKGVRKSDMSDAELAEILSNLMPLVRTDFILPPHHHTLLDATARGLIKPERRREHFLYSSDSEQLHNSTNRSRCSVKPSRPRLFVPYYEQAKALLQSRLEENPYLKHSLVRHHPLSGAVFCSSWRSTALSCLQLDDSLLLSSSDESVSGGRDVDLKDILCPNETTVNSILQHVQKLLETSNVVNHALACGCVYHRRQVVKQAVLRTVRECGYPDAMAALFLRTMFRRNKDHPMLFGADEICDDDASSVNICFHRMPYLIAASELYQANTLPRVRSTTTSCRSSIAVATSAHAAAALNFVTLPRPTNVKSMSHLNRRTVQSSVNSVDLLENLQRFDSDPGSTILDQDPEMDLNDDTRKMCLSDNDCSCSSAYSELASLNDIEMECAEVSMPKRFTAQDRSSFLQKEFQELSRRIAGLNVETESHMSEESE